MVSQGMQRSVTTGYSCKWYGPQIKNVHCTPKYIYPSDDQADLDWPVKSQERKKNQVYTELTLGSPPPIHLSPNSGEISPFFLWKFHLHSAQAQIQNSPSPLTQLNNQIHDSYPVFKGAQYTQAT